MSANNLVAEGIEKLGARTFSTHEMAFNLVGLLHPKMLSRTIFEPIWADLNGGLQFVKNLNIVTFDLRKQLQTTADIRRAVSQDTALDSAAVRSKSMSDTPRVMPRANMKFAFPKLGEKPLLSHLRNILDLDQVVVATGFGEVSIVT
jgi:3-oxoacyl-ACP reductase-like protein